MVELSPIDNSRMPVAISQFLIDGEAVLRVFQSARDPLVFSNERIIAANVQGLTGTTVDCTTIPYSKIGKASGLLNAECELDIRPIGTRPHQTVRSPSGSRVRPWRVLLHPDASRTSTAQEVPSMTTCSARSASPAPHT
jgi:hypothetical protein